MRTKENIVLACTLIIPLFYPFSLGAQVAPLLEEAITEAEVREFIQTYIDCYQARDLNRFLELFSKEGAENRMLPYADVREQYQKWFCDCLDFACQLAVSTVQTFGASAFVTGRYKITQTLKNGKKKIFHGRIQWDLIREAGSLKIRELNYGRSIEDD